MAILIYDKTICPICGSSIARGQRAVSFPPFVANELAPLRFFSDSSFHEDCFHRHSFSMEAISRLEEFKVMCGPDHRECLVCAKEIKDPDQYVAFGHLVSDPADPLFVYNYAQFHRHCLSQWRELASAKILLEALLHSGRWKGGSLNRLVNECEHL